MDTGQQSAAPGYCPGCGQNIDTRAVYCPNCGRPYHAGADSAAEMTPETTYATAPAQTAFSAVPPPLPTWAEQPTARGGIAGLAAGPTLTPEQPVRSHKRRNILTAISALVVVALIGTGAYWAYAAFASRTDSQLARYFPSTTVAFASADLLAAANNNFKINPANLTTDQASTLQKATGLNWQNDIMSWVGRDIAVGVFPLATGQQVQALANPADAVGVVALAQSRDDNAAKAAINKFTAHLKQQGSSLTQSSYKGFTLYATDPSAASGAFGSGSGWVIVASNANAAHAVIDRINGASSDTLGDQQAFKDATSNAPSNNFGTYYVNLRQILNTVVPVRAPNGLASISIPFVESFPVAGGYVGWTDSGERSQITLNAVRNPNIPNVSGDTTGFASLVPSDAVAYAGVGNLGKLTQAFIAQFGSLATGNDPLKSGFGVSASDPLAQQPAGIAAIKSGSNGVQPVFYMHVGNNAAATQLVNEMAAARNWTAKPMTIAGQSATGLYASAVDYGATPTNNGVATETAQLVGVALTLHNTLVIAPDASTATLIAQVAQGSVSNLSGNATFQKMVKAAPSGAAVTGYLSAAALQSYMHMGVGSAATAGLFSHFDALALTLVWNDSMLQGTVDAGLHS